MRKPTILFQPWHCEKCGAKGMVEHSSDEDFGAVMQDAEEQHSSQQPVCDGRIRFSELSRAAAQA